MNNTQIVRIQTLFSSKAIRGITACGVVAGAFLICLAPTLAQSSPPNVSEKQTIENGTSQELKGLTRVFVYSDLPEEKHSELISDLERSRQSLSVVKRPEEAEFFLVLRVAKAGSTFRVTAEPWINSTQGDIRTSPATKGELTVRYRAVGIAYVNRGEKLRVLFRFNEANSTKTYTHPWKDFTKAFIKELKQVNSQK